MDSFWDDQVDEVGAAMSALAVAENIEVVLHVVCEQVVHVIPGADTASVTMVAAEHARTAASTDRRALEIDGEQYELDDGPGPRVRSTCSGTGRTASARSRRSSPTCTRRWSGQCCR